MSDDNDKKKISRFHYTYIQANGAPAALIKENSAHFPLRPYASAQVKKKWIWLQNALVREKIENGIL